MRKGGNIPRSWVISTSDEQHLLHKILLSLHLLASTLANTKATETQYIALLHTDGSYATLTICKEKWQNIREASVPNRDTGKPNSPLWPCGILCIFSKFCKFSSKEIRYFATFRSGHKICTMSFYHVHRKSRMVGSASIQTGINYQIQLACKF